jgi:hypothetical protein
MVRERAEGLEGSGRVEADADRTRKGRRGDAWDEHLKGGEERKEKKGREQGKRIRQEKKGREEGKRRREEKKGREEGKRRREEKKGREEGKRRREEKKGREEGKRRRQERKERRCSRSIPTANSTDSPIGFDRDGRVAELGHLAGRRTRLLGLEVALQEAHDGDRVRQTDPRKRRGRSRRARGARTMQYLTRR